jgi:hypothetical protein
MTLDPVVHDREGTVILLLILVTCLLVALVIALVVVATTTTKIERILRGREKAIRGCPFCRSIIPPEASVCPSCTREVGAWVFHGGTWWSRADGSWEFLDGETWRPPDDGHPAPNDSA